MSAQVLVAGVGNIFHADDAFGSEVARRLLGGPVPEGVRVVDFGIRSIDLVHALLEPVAGLVLLDVLDRQQPPGTLFVLEPELGEPALPAEAGPAALAALEVHTMNPAGVLRFCRALGAELGWVRVVGCQPAVLGADDEPVQVGLSPPVAEALDRAGQLALELATGRLEQLGGGVRA